MIEIKGEMDKADITPVHALIGRLNADEFADGGVKHLPRTMIFAGFAGAYDVAKKKYVGVYRFEPLGSVKDIDLATMTVAQLPPAKFAKPTEAPKPISKSTKEFGDVI